MMLGRNSRMASRTRGTRAEHTGLGQQLADIVVHHRRAQLALVVEGEELEIGHHLAERLGERRQVQHRASTIGVGEQQLLGEQGLAGAGLPHEDVDGVAGESAAEHLVGLDVARADARRRIGGGGRGADGVPSGVECGAASSLRTVSVRRCAASGFLRKASAPASLARPSAARRLKMRTAVPLVAWSAFRRRQSASPSSFGTRISVITMAGRRVRASSRASRPSAANVTSNPASVRK